MADTPRSFWSLSFGFSLPDAAAEVRRITEHPHRAARVDDMRELYVVQLGSARGRGPRAERALRGWECGPGLVRPLR
jgi:hypothetical protein